jgi:hypothetical protein
MAVELDASNTGILTDLSQDLPVGATRHYLNGSDNDSGTAKIMVDAPGAGKRLILTHVSMSTVINESIIIQNGDVTLIGPIAFLAASPEPWQKDFKWGLKLTANVALKIKTSGDNQFHIYIEYIDAPS